MQRAGALLVAAWENSLKGESVMVARKVLHGAAGAAVLAAGMLVTASYAEADCKRHSHEGRATGLLRATAGIAARSDWRREVSEHDRPGYAWWSRARGRVTSCRNMLARRGPSAADVHHDAQATFKLCKRGGE